MATLADSFLADLEDLEDEAEEEALKAKVGEDPEVRAARELLEASERETKQREEQIREQLEAAEREAKQRETLLDHGKGAGCGADHADHRAGHETKAPSVAPHEQ